MMAGAEKPMYADVSALADAAADLPVTSPLTEGIMDIVNAADDWLELARKTVAKRNSGQKLGKCLQWMLSSLDRALEQFTLRLQVRGACERPCQNGALMKIRASAGIDGISWLLDYQRDVLPSHLCEVF